jgi:hypothetical protein
MSVYPQSRYGQVAQPLPPQPYPQHPIPPPQYHYPQPPPQPVYFVDPNAFRRDYASRLAELTVNSRPIIQSLSMLAQDYSRWADIVAQSIESHIRKVSPRSAYCLVVSSFARPIHGGVSLCRISYIVMYLLVILQPEQRNIDIAINGYLLLVSNTPSLSCRCVRPARRLILSHSLLIRGKLTNVALFGRLRFRPG